MTDIEFRIDDRELSRMAALFPRQADSAFVRSVRNAKAALWKAVRLGGGASGVAPLPKLSPLSAFLRPGARLGGALSCSSSRIVMYRAGGAWFVGWPRTLHDAASAWQSAALHATTPAERRYLHSRAGTAFDLALYDRPARPVIGPFSEYARGRMPEWFLSILVKSVERKLDRP